MDVERSYRTKLLSILSALIVITGCGGGSDATLNSSAPSYQIGLPLASGSNQSTDTLGSNPQTQPIAIVTNEIPIADAGRNQRVLVNSPVELDGTKSQPAADLKNYNWKLSSPIGSSAKLDDERSIKPKFTPDVEGLYAVSLIVNNGKLDSKISAVSVIASNTEAIPVANPGDKKIVKKGAVVFLDGSKSSDANGDQLIYDWLMLKMPLGSKAKLERNKTAKPVFVADSIGTYTVRLVVSDGKGFSDPSDIEITSTEGAVQPIADPGRDQTVIKGSVVTLNGSSSINFASGPLKYKWNIIIKPDGSAATIVDAIENPVFTADLPGKYWICLTVNDGKSDSESRCTLVTSIYPADAPPIAVIADTPILPAGNLIRLNGINSISPNGKALSYVWNIQSKPLGSTANISFPTSANPSIKTDVRGEYIVSLVVNDALRSSNIATVVITAKDPPDLSYLNGRVTLQYKERFATAYSPADRYIVDLYFPNIQGEPATIVGRPSESVTNRDQTTITCNKFFYPMVILGQSDYLYSCDAVWTTFRRIFIFKINADKSMDGITAICTADVSFRESCLSNLILSQNPSLMIGSVESLQPFSNLEPVANAQGSQSITVGSYAYLNGSSSFDPEGTPLTFLWSIKSKPSTSITKIFSATASTPYLIIDRAGDYVVSLVVSDGNLSSTNVSEVTITALSRLLPSATAPSGSSSCCRVCTTGKACGDSCIAKSYSCNVGAGCAC